MFGRSVLSGSQSRIIPGFRNDPKFVFRRPGMRTNNAAGSLAVTALEAVRGLD